MDFNFDLNLIQSHKILLTPQLKQALAVLRMNSQELTEYIEEQLELNPVLEITEDSEDLGRDSYITTVEALEWEDSLNKKQEKDRENANTFDISEFAADKASIELTLKEHLLFQLHTSSLDEQQILIGEYLIGNIDENGYLLSGTAEVASYFNIPVSKINKVLEHVQTFDPPGICARTLKECLLIQLHQRKSIDPNVIKVVENHLDDLASNKISTVAKSLGISIKEVGEIFDFIRTLEPKPGREFCIDSNVRYIVPDVIVKKIKDKFEILTNEDSIPILNISEYYRKILDKDLNDHTLDAQTATDFAVDEGTRKFIQNRIESASWLIKCIEQRKNTVRKVAQGIVEKQMDFFENGKNYIKPLTMKTVAKVIDIHESTVSRTVNGKYIQCPWGVFEMRYFFTGKISTGSGGEVSTENIKMMLKNIIKLEDKKKPLSDNKIAEILKNAGIEISRRTIAKYRGEMGIPIVSQRKKY